LDTLTLKATLHELTVPVDHWHVRSLVTGTGAPLVLVHGLGTSAWCWQRNLEELGGCRKVYAVDLPGFGQSDTPEHVLCPEDLADVLMRWCLQLNLQQVDMVGHSIGGEIAMWFAAKYPTMVQRMVLAAPTGYRTQVSVWRRLGRLLLDGLREPPSFLPNLIRAYARAGPQRMLLTAQSSDAEALGRRFGDIHAETLVVAGRRDPVVPLEEARQLTNRLPNARLEVLEEAAHGMIFDDAAHFNPLVCMFLDS
jgi:pimeloyl-ACP methyl ester carboxylesterase